MIRFKTHESKICHTIVTIYGYLPAKERTFTHLVWGSLSWQHLEASLMKFAHAEIMMLLCSLRETDGD